MMKGRGPVLPARRAGLLSCTLPTDGDDGLQSFGVHRRQRMRRQKRQLPAEVRQHAGKLHVLVRSRIRALHREWNSWILHRSL